MKFLYSKNREQSKLVELLDGWSESGHYIVGIDKSDNRYKTYLKYKVSEYIDGSENYVNEPFPTPPVRIDKTNIHQPEILFTGFSSAPRLNLERKASRAGLHVCKSVTVNLAYLCTGPNAGPAKVVASRAAHVFILTEPQFNQMLETGELPDEEDRY